MTHLLDTDPLILDDTITERPCHLRAQHGCPGLASHAGMCLGCGDVSLLCFGHAEWFASLTLPLGECLVCEPCGRRGFVPTSFRIDPL